MTANYRVTVQTLKPRNNRKPKSKRHKGAASPISKQNLKAFEQQKKALELRLLGYKLSEIADELGYYGEGSAYKAICSAMKNTLREPADAVREMELDRLDGVLRRLQPRLDTGEPMAVNSFIRICTHRARLLGLFMDHQDTVIINNIDKNTDGALLIGHEGKEPLVIACNGAKPADVLRSIRQSLNLNTGDPSSATMADSGSKEPE